MDGGGSITRTATNGNLFRPDLPVTGVEPTSLLATLLRIRNYLLVIFGLAIRNKSIRRILVDTSLGSERRTFTGALDDKIGCFRLHPLRPHHFRILRSHQNADLGTRRNRAVHQRVELRWKEACQLSVYTQLDAIVGALRCYFTHGKYELSNRLPGASICLGVVNDAPCPPTTLDAVQIEHELVKVLRTMIGRELRDAIFVEDDGCGDNVLQLRLESSLSPVTDGDGLGIVAPQLVSCGRMQAIATTRSAATAALHELASAGIAST
mmetsp:Transcript_21165/g.49959  ORF Transcript_21165/g.49959 Transcript_21165/m.49959 type:complete len:266 (-) Transcript_21165:215-1012(-)